MQHEKRGISGRAAVILGAGASRGEDHNPDESAVLPPLDSDFFSQLQKLGTTHQAVNEVLEVARSLFGPVPRVTMEQFFVRIEFLASVAKHFSGETSGVANRYEKAQQTFKEALLQLLYTARVVSGRFARRDPRCHNYLFRHLEPEDAIISFNYDLVADNALARMGGVPWEPRLAYGVIANGALDKWRGDHRAHEAPSDTTVYLLKMHGSLNWLEENGKLTLTEDPYVASKMLIVPPAWDKPVDQVPIIQNVWRKAREALLESDVLIVVGYSLPQTDVWTTALMRACAEERSKRLRYILVANPDENAIDRIISTISPAIGKGTRVITFASFFDLIDFLAAG